MLIQSKLCRRVGCRSLGIALSLPYFQFFYSLLPPTHFRIHCQRTEPCNTGDAAQSNGQPEKKSGSGRDSVVLNDNNSKTTIPGKLSVSQNVDPLLKETKSLGRLSVTQNSDPSTKETKAVGRSSTSHSSDSKPLGRLSVSQNSDVAKESRTLSCMLLVFFFSIYISAG